MADEDFESGSTVTSVGFKLNSRLSADGNVKFTAMYVHNTLKDLWLSCSYLPIFVKLRLIKSNDA